MFSPPSSAFEAMGGGFYKSEPLDLGGRSADWKVQPVRDSWHARLRVGIERYPGVGKTATAALEAAAAEAAQVATCIAAMLPPGGGLRELAQGAEARRRGKAPARKGGR
jgi:hypothetical protein